MYTAALCIYEAPAVVRHSYTLLFAMSTSHHDMLTLLLLLLLLLLQLLHWFNRNSVHQSA
jgi:hypothetical protein